MGMMVESERHATKLYESIGRFVISFQQLEDTYRHIGWYILDPDRKNWPPRELRQETNRDLIDRVSVMVEDLIRAQAFENGDAWLETIRNLRESFHELRRYRNSLLHSAYNALETKHQIFAHHRADTKLMVDPDTGEVSIDGTQVTAEQVLRKIVEHSESILLLYRLRTQLFFWWPRPTQSERSSAVAFRETRLQPM